MEKPSKHWTGFEHEDLQLERNKRIQQIIVLADFIYLATRAIECRKQEEPKLSADVGCTVNRTQFTSGFHNLVLELAFTDDVYWIARIPYQQPEDTDQFSLLSEIATMRIVREKTTIPVPKVFRFDLSVDNPFGQPYVLMEYLPGRTLPDIIADATPEEHLPKVAKQLANVLTELQKLSFDRIGRLWCGEQVDQPPEIISMAWHAVPGPLDTSLEYFYHERQQQNRKAMAISPGDPECQTACWILKNALSEIVIEDRVHGPFPLCHLDMHYANMLFDDDFNLTAIIDWEHAQAAPLEQLSVCPDLVTFPGRSAEKNAPILELKRLVIEALREREKTEEKPKDGDQHHMLLSDYMASPRALIMYRQYMNTPKRTVWSAKQVAKIMYGETVTWEQLKTLHGDKTLF